MLRYSLPLLFFISLPACSNDGASDATSTSATTGSASPTAATGEECSPGLEGCPCHEGKCIIGLLCLSDLCVEPPPQETTGDDPTGSGGGEATGSTSDSGEPLGCDTNFDCDAYSVCWEAACVPTSWLKYEVTVTKFTPPVCRDGVGTAEVTYNAYVNEELVLASSEASCPAGWPTEKFQIAGYDTVALEFWEADAFSDDYFAKICWQQWVEGECSEMPDYVFHDYGFSGYTGDFAFEFAIEVWPVEYCGNLGC